MGAAQSTKIPEYNAAKMVKCKGERYKNFL